jgi:hypothetical protein
MKRYLVLYRATGSAMDQMRNATPEQVEGVKAAWQAWAKKAGSTVVDIGAPCTHPQKYAAKAETTKGDYTIGGFSIFQAESNEALSKALDGHPHFSMPGSAIEVHEIVPIM